MIVSREVSVTVDLDHLTRMLNCEAGLAVLDLGTGTGIWPVEVAEEYPLAQVWGIDMCAIFRSPTPSKHDSGAGLQLD
jgi:ubiquinone/menaquinone biosynthesis C-methylase UbiE